jgi:hypothetical protein
MAVRRPGADPENRFALFFADAFDCAVIVQKKPCCIATVQEDGANVESQTVNPLYEFRILRGGPLACRLHLKTRGCCREGGRIRADKVESSVNVSGALSPLASLKRGRRGEGCGAHQNGECEDIRRRTQDADGPFASSADAPTGIGPRFRLRLDDAITALWVLLLLSIVAYALVEGEAVLAELDGLDLVAAYSLAP